MLGEATTGEEAVRILTGRWDLAAPSHWKAEFANVVWKAVQLDRIAAEDADAVISRASALPLESVDVGELWRGAVARAIAAAHPVYDTLFVELAARLGTTMVSYDARLRRKFPSLVKRPALALSR